MSALCLPQSFLKLDVGTHCRSLSQPQTNSMLKVRRKYLPISTALVSTTLLARRFKRLTSRGTPSSNSPSSRRRTTTGVSARRRRAISSATTVLRLTYTAHDMTPFARDLEYDGPPFTWDEKERRHLRARLDALYFHLYGLDREDADYVLSTFPIVRREDEAAFGSYRTRDLVLAYMNALAAGDTETDVAV